MKKQNNKSLNIKVPDPWSSGEPPGNFMSNEFSVFNLVFFRCLVRGCGKGSKMKKKNNKSFNIKVPDPWSSGERPGSVLSNEFLCFFHCTDADTDSGLQH